MFLSKASGRDGLRVTAGAALPLRCAHWQCLYGASAVTADLGPGGQALFGVGHYSSTQFQSAVRAKLCNDRRQGESNHNGAVYARARDQLGSVRPIGTCDL
jgi:hypothetical protein